MNDYVVPCRVVSYGLRYRMVYGIVWFYGIMVLSYGFMVLTSTRVPQVFYGVCSDG
jgi:hypothetical protein